MEGEGTEERRILRQESPGERFYYEADNGAQAESMVGIGPVVFQHFSESACHELDIVHLIQMAHHVEFYTAAKRFDKVAGEAGATTAKFVDDPDTGLYAGSDALPLDGMIKEAIAVIERYIEGTLGFAPFAREEVLRGRAKVFCPEETGPFGF